MLVIQIWLGVFSLGAVYLSQDYRIRRRQWACVCGLLAQPAWFYATWQAEQWGIFAMSVLYTLSWLRGVKTYWWSELSAWTRGLLGEVDRS